MAGMEDITARLGSSRARWRGARRWRAVPIARLGALTPGIAPGSAQTWHTYLPVEVLSATRVVSALTRTET